MNKNRLEAFSDGVIAVIITIMVLELKAPVGQNLNALRSLFPIFFSYVLSYTFIGIYWSNHHHLLQAAEKVTGAILWANLHLLFWLSLIPFATAWMGENNFTTWPVALYGVVLICAAIAYYILAHLLIAHHGKRSKLASALGADFKGIISILIYATAIPLAFVKPWLAYSLYIFVAVIWLVPDRRIENKLKK
jgi:uncharacterized membrane protein